MRCRKSGKATRVLETRERGSPPTIYRWRLRRRSRTSKLRLRASLGCWGRMPHRVLGARRRWFVGRRGRRSRDVLVDGLALVVVLGVLTAVRAGDGLRRFVGFEAQVARLVLPRAVLLAEAVIAEHQVIVRLQILRIYAEDVFKLFDRVGVAALEEENAAQFIAHHPVARILRQHLSQVANGLVVAALRRCLENL